MKKILIILFLLISVIGKTQVVDTIQVGNYMIASFPDSSVYIAEPYGSEYKVSTPYGATECDTIFYVPTASPADTIATLLTAISSLPNSIYPALLFENDGKWGTQITVPRDSMYFGNYGGNGEKPVIDGADMISSFDMNFQEGVIQQISKEDSTENLVNKDFTWGGWIKGSNTSADDDSTFTTTASDAIREATCMTAGKWYKLWFKGTTTADGIYVGQGSTGASLKELTGTLTSPFDTIVYFQASDSYGLDLYIRNTTAGTTVVNDISLLEYDINVWQKDSIFVKPNVVYLRDTIAIPQDTISSITADKNWFWDVSDSTFYIYSESDPGSNVELGQRKAIVNVSNRNYITLSNLTIQHSNENSVPATQDFGSGAVLLNGGSNLVVTGCIIQKNGYFGVRAIGGSSSNLFFNNNTFYRNGEGYKNGSNLRISSARLVTFTNNSSTYSGKDGLIIQGTDNLDIHNNTFSNNNAAGLYIIQLDTALIYKNTFDSNGDAVDDSEDYAIGVQSCNEVDIYQNTITNQANNDAIQIYSDNIGSGSSNNVSIYRNFISGVTGGDCIGIGAENDTTAKNLQIFYNLIANADEYAIYLSNSSGDTIAPVTIYNNTIYGNTLSGIATTATYPLIIKNNILMSNGEEDLKVITGYLTTSNNLYYRASGNVVRYNSNYYTPATVTTFETSSQNTNPLFTDVVNEDFTLQTGSPAINNGVDVGLTTDILGNPIVGNPDIGSYESQTQE